MHIKDIKSQHRRDSQAVYVCEHCGHEHEASGYDDAYSHGTVIPQMECNECGSSGSSASGAIAPRTTRYAEGTQA